MDSFINAVDTAIGWMPDSGTPAYIAWGIVIAVFVLIAYFIVKFIFKADKMFTAVMHRKKDHDKRDVQRVYTVSEKSLASKSCENRCEGTGIIFRCKYVGGDLQGDHWFPHSRGGATTVQNLVMLCPSCNRSKSDKIPTRMQTVALNRRRRKQRGGYISPMPPVGQWLPRGYRAVNDTPSPVASPDSSGDWF